MILLDTSILIPGLRKNGSGALALLMAQIGNSDFSIPRFVELELLQGVRDEPEWSRLTRFLSQQELVSPSERSWAAAARTMIDLKRNGLTIRSVIDCCIAEMAMERGLTLLHFDRDYELIARHRPLSHAYLDLSSAKP